VQLFWPLLWRNDDCFGFGAFSLAAAQCFAPLVASHITGTSLIALPIIFSYNRQLSIARDMVECASTRAGIA
jgi:hypothetical protein